MAIGTASSLMPETNPHFLCGKVVRWPALVSFPHCRRVLSVICVVLSSPTCACAPSMPGAVAAFAQRVPGKIQPDNPTQNFLSEHGVAYYQLQHRNYRQQQKGSLSYQKTNISLHYLRLGNVLKYAITYKAKIMIDIFYSNVRLSYVDWIMCTR